MQNLTYILHLTLVVVLSFVNTPVHAASGYAGEFLELGAGARAMAIGNSFVAVSDDATATYWNPAGLSNLNESELHLMHSDRFSGQVKHDFIALTRPSKYLNQWGIALLRVGVPDIAFTELSDPGSPLSETNRPIVTSRESSSDYALFFSGAKEINSRINVGLSLKFIYRTIATFHAYGAGIDLGAFYRVGRNTKVGVNLHDATTTPVHWSTDSRDIIHPKLAIGSSYTNSVIGGNITAAISTILRTSARNDESTIPLYASLEYAYSVLSLRLGLESDSQAVGIGLRPNKHLAIDLAYTQHEMLESTYQFSANFSL